MSPAVSLDIVCLVPVHYPLCGLCHSMTLLPLLALLYPLTWQPQVTVGHGLNNNAIDTIQALATRLTSSHIPHIIYSKYLCFTQSILFLNYKLNLLMIKQHFFNIYISLYTK